MNSLPAQLYTAEQVRRIEQRVFSAGTAAGTLMHRAGLRAYRILREKWPSARRVSIVCGPGNNGGDGYVIAALAAKAGLEVQLIQHGEPRSADARAALTEAREAGAKLSPYYAGALGQSDVVVDALLGIGLSNEPRAPFTEIIAEINAVDAPCLSVDIPSGLLADSGAAAGSRLLLALRLGYLPVVGRTVPVRSYSMIWVWAKACGWSRILRLALVRSGFELFCR